MTPQNAFNLAFLTSILSFAFTAKADFKMGLYAGTDENGERCTLEVRGIQRKMGVLQSDKVTILTSSERALFEIAPTLQKTATGESLNLLIWAAQHDHGIDRKTIVRVDLDDISESPIRYVYFNNENAPNEPIRLHKCNDLSFDENPQPDELSVLPE